MVDAIAFFMKREILGDEQEDGKEFAVDGGSLLYKIPWRKYKYFSAIPNTYTIHVSHHYKRVTVGFDGYESVPSTTDAAHLKRSACVISPDVHIEGSINFTTRIELFLSNKANKLFIKFL